MERERDHICGPGGGRMCQVCWSRSENRFVRRFLGAGWEPVWLRAALSGVVMLLGMLGVVMGIGTLGMAADEGYSVGAGAVLLVMGLAYLIWPVVHYRLWGRHWIAWKRREQGGKCHG